MMTTTLDIKHFNIFHFNLTIAITLTSTQHSPFHFKLDKIVIEEKQLNDIIYTIKFNISISVEHCT
jgi:hypothetical protein